MQYWVLCGFEALVNEIGLDEGDLIVSKTEERLGLIVGLDEGDCEIEGELIRMNPCPCLHA